MILFYDTETTGLPDYRSPSDAEHQPHIVQFAAILVDSQTKIERASVDLIVKPEGWTIPDKVARIHGITTEIAESCGVPELTVANLFLALRAQTALEVAHNIPFDRRILRIAMLRAGIDRNGIEALERGDEFCTMKASKNIVNLPPTERMLAAGIKGPKPPKLEEAYEFFFGKKMDGAHNALVDVRACARLYFHLLEIAK